MEFDRYIKEDGKPTTPGILNGYVLVLQRLFHLECGNNLEFLRYTCLHVKEMTSCAFSINCSAKNRRMGLFQIPIRFRKVLSTDALRTLYMAPSLSQSTPNSLERRPVFNVSLLTTMPIIELHQQNRQQVTVS